MALVLADRVNETTTTTGTGTVTLAGAVNGYQSFAAIGNGNTTYYTIVHQTLNEWEVGIGTYTSVGTTLSRSTILASSNSGLAVSFSAGTKFVFCDYPAGRAVYLDSSTNVTVPQITLSSGTANGVLYLNGSKVATSGSALTFDGTTVLTTPRINVTNTGTGATFSSSGGSGLKVYGASGTNQWDIYLNGANVRFSDNTGGGAVKIDTNAIIDGNVGIGTSSPAYKLEVASGSTDASALFNSTAANGSHIRLASSGTVKNYIGCAAGFITGGAADDLGLRAVGKISFATNGAGADMVLDASGNLGIGSTNPQAVLDLGGGTNGRGITWGGSTGANQYSTIWTEYSSGSLILGAGVEGSTSASSFLYSYTGTIGTSAIELDSFGSDGIKFYTDSAAARTAGTVATMSERMRISQSGNVGIGTASPAYKLDVSGTVYASSDIRAPIFNDSNNTAWYLDPASTSELNTVYIDYLRIDGTANGIYTGNTYLDVRYGASGGGGVRLYDADGALQSYWYGDGSGRGGLLDNDGTWAVKVGIGTEGLRLYCNNNEEFIVNETHTLSVGSSRAPIFYDSDNTAWYLDPASTSILSKLAINNSSTSFGGQLTVRNAGAGYNTVFQTSDFSAASAGSQLVIQPDPVATTGNTLFCLSVDHGGGLTPNAGAIILGYNGGKVGISGVSTPTYQLDVTGTGRASSDFRAPIFYDSDNTSYYVDAASTSILDTARIYSGNFGTTSALSSMGVIGIYRSSSPFISFHDGTTARTAYMQETGSRFYFGEVTYTESEGSFRAPLFYDVNNTGYYVDPASTSEINKVYYNSNMVSRNYGIGQVGLYASTRLQAVFAMGESYVLSADGTSAGTLYGIAWSYPSAGGVAANLASHGMLILENGAFKGAWGGGSLRTTSDVRGTLFYDWDNTGYYVDPASTSNLNVLGVQRAYAGYDSGVTNSFSCSDWFRSNGNTGWYNASYGGGIYMIDSTWVRVYNSKQFYADSIIQSGSSVRAPIFYDSNDTAYYLDPEGYSQLGRMRLFSVVNDGGAGAMYGRNHAYDTVELRGYGSEMMIGSQGTTIYINYRSCNGGTANHTPSQWYWNAGSSSSWANHQSNRWEAVTDSRAPIFYDRDNTGYYMDPSSSGNVQGNWEFSSTDNSSTSYSVAAIEIRESNKGGSLSYLAPRLAFHWGGVVASQISINASGEIVIRNNPGTGFENLIGNILYADSSLRGPIFYDTDNTSYYVNPHSASRVNEIQSDRTYGFTDIRSPIFYDYNNTAYYADLSSTGDSIRAAGNIVAYYSDERLKTHLGKIENALEKVDQLEGFYYEANEVAQKLGYKAKREVGVSAQAVQRVLPEIVTDAPISANYLTIDYERLVPLLIEAIKELKGEVETLKSRLH